MKTLKAFNDYVIQFCSHVTDSCIEYIREEYKEHTRETLNLYAGNQTAFDGSPEAQELEMLGLQPIRKREVERRYVQVRSRDA